MLLSATIGYYRLLSAAIGKIARAIHIKERGLISITLLQYSMVYAMLVLWHDGGNCIALNKARDIIDRGYVALHTITYGLGWIQACMCVCVLDCNIKEIFQSQRMTLLLLPARSCSFQYLNSPQKPDVLLWQTVIKKIFRQPFVRVRFTRS